MKIVSLLASATELVCELGAGDALVGRSHECDHPAWVKDLPALTRPAFATNVSSAEIDALVRERLNAGLPLYDVDDSLLAQLDPDIIITQTHCNVCAPSPADIGGGGPGPPERAKVVALTASTVAQLQDDFLRVGDIIGRRAQAQALIARIEEEQRERDAKLVGIDPIRVACIEWMEPLFFMSNWGPELVARGGGIDVLGKAGQHSRAEPWEKLEQADPDVVIVAPCGFDLVRTRAELATLTNDLRWHSLRAVRAGRAFYADGNLYFNRSGPSVFSTVQALAQMLHPALFPPTLQGRVWQRLET